MSSPSLVPLSRDRHATYSWRRYTSYAFASRLSTVPIFGPELGIAALRLPLAFLPRDDGFYLVAVLGLDQEANLCVDGAGNWLAGYIPATLRSYPFGVLKTTGGEYVVCVDENSSFISPIRAAETAEPIFDHDGQLSTSVKPVVAFLGQLEQTRPATDNACAALNAHGIIVPWALAINLPSGVRKIEGLYSVDEAALNALPTDAFMELRDRGALTVAYSQMLSMRNLEQMVERAKALDAVLQSSSAPYVGANGDLDLSFLDGDTLKLS